MTQRGPAQNYSPDLFSEETPMDDILTSIRTMVVEEEIALTKLKEISDEVGQMVDALGHDHFDKNERNTASADNSNAELLHKQADISDHDDIETEDNLEREEGSSNKPTEKLVLPLPGTEGLEDAVEDFLTDDTEWKKYRTESTDEERFSPEKSAQPPAFLQEYANLSLQKNQETTSVDDSEDQDEYDEQQYDDADDEQDSLHTSSGDVFAPDASLQHVLNLTTVVHSDGSISEDEEEDEAFKTTFSNQVAHHFAQHFTGTSAVSAVKEKTSDNEVLSQAFEIIVARMTAPMIEKWLEEHGPALFEQIMKKRFQ